MLNVHFKRVSFQGLMENKEERRERPEETGLVDVELRERNVIILIEETSVGP